jgi:monofunctional glycosyltransferase
VPFFSVPVQEAKEIKQGKTRDVDERVQDGERGPAGGEREDGPATPVAAAPEPPLDARPAEPSQSVAPMQLVWWPRAAGGGAAAVSAPAALMTEPAFRDRGAVPAGPPPAEILRSPEPEAPADVPSDAAISPRVDGANEPDLPSVPVDDAISAWVEAGREPAAVAQPAPMDPLPDEPWLSDKVGDATGGQPRRPPPSEPHAGPGGRAVNPTVEAAYARVPVEHFFPPPGPAGSATAGAIATPAPAVAVPVPRAPAARRRYLRRAASGIALLLLALTGLVLALIVAYRWVDPPISALMLGQRLAGDPIMQRWVPLERISPNLQLATIVSEDGRFCRHWGVDWDELEGAIESARDGIARGGSTITMQVAKNLFLWPSKSYVRKAIEIPLTYVIEAAWSKRRILEIYLNVAEWGPGVFGAEAAARYHFRKPASQLSAREAALLAVSLPNPFERQAGSPGPGTSRLADNLQARMRTAQGSVYCLRAR